MFHIPGYNWLGPGTPVYSVREWQERAKTHPPVNWLDEAAMYHDLKYISHNPKARRKADIDFLNRIYKDSKKRNAFGEIPGKRTVRRWEYQVSRNAISVAAGVRIPDDDEEKELPPNKKFAGEEKWVEVGFSERLSNIEQFGLVLQQMELVDELRDLKKSGKSYDEISYYFPVEGPPRISVSKEAPPRVFIIK